MTGNEPGALTSAPDLILDLLSANGKPLSVQALCRAGAVMGIAESAIRVGLTRLGREQKVLRSGRGMYAYQRDALGRVLDDWQGPGRRTVAWNKHWIAVYGANVPRGDKTVWRRHSLALALLGFAELQPGLHIRPDNLSVRLESFHGELLALGLSPNAIVCRMVDLPKPQQQAACALWDVRAREAEYGRWVIQLDKSRRSLPQLSKEQALCETLTCGRAVLAFLIRDPLLPPELMSPLPRQALVEAVSQYTRAGRKLWQTWLAS